jgi:hypothetical protein
METSMTSEQPGRLGIQTMADYGSAWNVYNSWIDAAAGNNSTTTITAEVVYSAAGSSIGMGSNVAERGADFFQSLSVTAMNSDNGFSFQ